MFALLTSMVACVGPAPGRTCQPDTDTGCPAPEGDCQTTTYLLDEAETAAWLDPLAGPWTAALSWADGTRSDLSVAVVATGEVAAVEAYLTDCDPVSAGDYAQRDAVRLDLATDDGLLAESLAAEATTNGGETRVWAYVDASTTAGTWECPSATWLVSVYFDARGLYAGQIADEQARALASW